MLLADLRYAVRTLSRAPGFTLAVVLTRVLPPPSRSAELFALSAADDAALASALRALAAAAPGADGLSALARATCAGAASASSASTSAPPWRWSFSPGSSLPAWTRSGRFSRNR